MVPLPKLTKKNYKLFLYRLRDNDADKYSYINSMKVFFMLSDTRMATEKEFHDGEVPIFDMSNYTLKHLTKVALPVMKKYMLYTQEAHPIKLREIHVINAPSFCDKVLAVLKPFMKSEVAKMLHFYPPNSPALYEYVPKELLPVDYGGENGKIEELKKYWIQKILDKRDYFLDDSKWKVDESKRSIENTNEHTTLNMQGSFRSLSID